MKKSLLLSFFLPPAKGGMENYFLNLSSRLPSDKIVWLAAPQSGAEKFDSKQPFKIIRCSYQSFLRFFKLTFLSLYFKLKKIIAAEAIECIWCGHIFPLAITAHYLKKFHGFPYIVFTHGRDIFEIEQRRYKQYYFRKIAASADYFIVTTDFMKRHLIKLGVAKDKIKKIPPGVDSQIFRPGLETTSLRTKHNLSNSPVLLTVSRLAERKGHQLVLDALPKILKKHPTLKYIIVGNGPTQEKIEQKIKQLSLEKNVILAGRVSDQELPQYYNLADIFIMTSEYLLKQGDLEGFGIVYLEAAACGLVAVAGNRGGEAEAVINEKTGLLINPTPNEIEKAVTSLLTDAGRRQRFGQTARQRVEKDFNWTDLAAKLEKLLP